MGLITGSLNSDGGTAAVSTFQMFVGMSSKALPSGVPPERRGVLGPRRQLPSSPCRLLSFKTTHTLVGSLRQMTIKDYTVEFEGRPEATPTNDGDLPLVRTSERNDFKRCPWLWKESWVKGLTSNRTPTWSWFGTAIHAGLEVRYKPGKKRGSTKKVLEAFEESMDGQIGKIYTEGGEVEESEIVDGRELGIAMLKGYIEEYGEEKHIEVIGSEQSFQIDVPHPTKPGEVICVYAGTWDSLWRIDGVLWVVDHKTRKQFPANTDFYDINDQAGSYLWVVPEVMLHLGILNKKEVKKIMGLQFNLLRKQMPSAREVEADGMVHNKPVKADYEAALSPFMNLPTRLPTIAVLEQWAASEDIHVIGEVSKVQPQPLFKRIEVERSLKERAQQGKRVQDEALWMNAVRNGEMPVFKTPTEDCVRCQLFDYCQADEHDHQEGQELAQVLLRRRDPYADHREAMERGGVVLKSKEK